MASDQTSPDGNGNYALRLFQNSTGIGYGISALSYIVDANGSQLYAASNPALTSDGQFLFLSWIDAAGVLHWVRSVTSVQSGNIQWGPVVSNQAGLPYIYSPSLTTFFDSNGTPHVITSAMTSDRILWIGQFAASGNPNGSMSGYSQFNNIGMSPGLGTYNNGQTIYVGYPTNANSHSL